VEALRRLNGAARSVVLSLPSELMERPAQHSAALARLAATRSRFAARGRLGSEQAVEALWRSGASFLRLPGASLLARDGAGPTGAASLVRMLAANGIATIASGVRTEAEAIELARLGIALMADMALPDPARSQTGSGAGDVVHM